MKKTFGLSKAASAFLALTMFVMPLASFGQTRISAPKNKYKIEDDIKAGQQAAQQAEQQLPILRDSYITNYVATIGDRLVAAIPSEFQHPEFRYSFKVVNASDINAFALPGGPMYVNRGMIEAAKNEGEMAGVMAHELSHVALRHGTAGATKQGSIGSQILGIGAILGGAILAGESGAQLGALGAQAYFTKFSREYETQADVLGSQIMARAGYDPHDLANMFQTIAKQGGRSGAPQWLSSHPDPGNRFNRINQESALLRVSNNPIKVTRDFQNVQGRLREMPRAQSSAEIEKNGQRNPNGTANGGNNSPTANGRYSNRVELPSTRTRAYSAGNFLRLSVPDNWRDFSANTDVTFAPEGGYGSDGITRGAMIGVVQSNGQTNLQTATQNYVSDLLQGGNSYLRQQGRYYNANIDGRNALQTTLAGRSPITNQTEIVTIYTTQLRDGTLLYIATVAPQNEANR
ncbi:MAG: M48 family metalloprotease, partial [Pyrinomonadaceae bacterium]